jgi:hypothetical protein
VYVRRQVGRLVATQICKYVDRKRTGRWTDRYFDNLINNKIKLTVYVKKYKV